MKYLTPVIVFAVLIVTVIVFYYSPAFDRLFIRPCHYYPHAFKNCKEEL